ncbi:MAG: thiamine phosphate synthase [Acidobacteria bacterium]|nr:thiamine phosphate synthase [Acidobacteriota bacterium]MCW5969063.1 thiamine phosphate synthase [Blastocatellales bacterium]
MTAPLTLRPRLPRRRPLLYLITDRRIHPPTPANPKKPSDFPAEWQVQLDAIEAAARAGCHLIQIREHDLPARQLAAFTRAAIRIARPHGALVLVNDRLDVALASDADGVHLRASSISACEARQIAEGCGRPDFLIGASVHNFREAEEAVAGADFIVCGPVYDTPSKRAFGPPLGLERFAEIARSIQLPALALGGVTMENFRDALRAGAAGIAAISLFADPLTVEASVRRMLAMK